MLELASEYGYLGLFALSFVAATLIAAPSDVLAMAMPSLGYEAVIVALVATAGGYLGNLVNYGIGYYGAGFILSRFVSDERQSKWGQRAERVYERYGVWSLLLSGTPFIGDPLTTVAGGFRVNLMVFSALVIIGKLIKFALLLGAVDGLRSLWG
jgi:membrane protein YqaA with SNARE-associated domain